MTEANYHDSSAIEELELVDDIAPGLQIVPVEYDVEVRSQNYIHRAVLLNEIELIEDLDYTILRNPS